MSQGSVTILGAGIGGLTLGQCLRNKGIPAIIYAKVSSTSTRHSYGITLHPSSHEALSVVLGIYPQILRRGVAVDNTYNNGTGKIYPGKGAVSNGSSSTSSRANRSKVERLLRQGLDIQCEHALQSIKPATQVDSNLQGMELVFENNYAIKPSSLIIDALGVHSPLRKTLLPEQSPIVLPYVVFSGKRRLTLAEFQATYAPSFQDGNVLETRLPTNVGDAVFLQISVNNHHPSSGEVDISYLYSRPARLNREDPLLRPDRPNAGATDTPEEFYTELSALSNQDLLSEPFATTFAPSAVRKDRVLHWLMRTTLPPSEPHDLNLLATNSVIMIGDSARATPILGGDGANAAIQDAVELADLVAEASSPLDTHAIIKEYYDASAYSWRREFAESEARTAERRLGEMHSAPRAAL